MGSFLIIATLPYSEAISERIVYCTAQQSLELVQDYRKGEGNGKKKSPVKTDIEHGAWSIGQIQSLPLFALLLFSRLHG